MSCNANSLSNTPAHFLLERQCINESTEQFLIAENLQNKGPLFTSSLRVLCIAIAFVPVSRSAFIIVVIDLEHIQRLPMLKLLATLKSLIVPVITWTMAIIFCLVDQCLNRCRIPRKLLQKTLNSLSQPVLCPHSGK